MRNLIYIRFSNLRAVTHQFEATTMTRTFEPETNTFLMMRGIDNKRSLLFALFITVEQDEDDPTIYSATIAGMEDRMAASGLTREEAIENAKMLFMATADDCLRDGLSVQFATNQSAVTVKFPISMAPMFYELLESELAQEDSELENWFILPAAAASHQHATD